VRCLGLSSLPRQPTASSQPLLIVLPAQRAKTQRVTSSLRWEASSRVMWPSCSTDQYFEPMVPAWCCPCTVLDVGMKVELLLRVTSARTGYCFFNVEILIRGLYARGEIGDLSQWWIWNDGGCWLGYATGTLMDLMLTGEGLRRVGIYL
jgi:hypothetical protein